MSSDNAQSAVTYTSISSYSDGPSWGIPLTNASEFSEMDPYEEVSQQGHVHPLSPAYVPYPMELDEHVPVYVPEPQHPEYHAPSDDDIQVEDDDEEPEEDPSEEHEPEDDNEDPEEDPNEEHELEDSDETEPFEKNEIAVTPSPPRHRGAKISVRPQTPMAASTKALIDAFASGSSPFPLPPTSPAYDQAHLGHRASMIRRTDDILKEDMPPWRRFTLTGPPPGCDVAESSAAAARAPRSQYNFVDTVEAGHGLIRSPGHYTWTIARDADRAEDVGYRQSAEDLAVTQLMRIHTLEARARADTVEDADSSWTEGVVGLSQWLEKIESGTLKKKLMDKYYPKGEIKKLEIELWNLKVKGNDVAAYTQRFQEQALMCTKFLTDETKKVDKYISGLPDNIHGNKLRTYAERQNENKRKANDSPRNNQQQPHKKQNVARAYTAGPGEKKVYTGDLPLCTKCNYHHTGQWHIKKNYPKLKNRGNGSGNGVAQGRVYALGGRDASLDPNVITGTFLLNNRYAKILFDTGADRSFVSTTFSALIDITPTTLENHYDVELADGKIIGVNTIIRGYTLNIMNHPFNIDLMPVPLTQEYLSKGCDVFLANVTTKEAKDKSERRRLEDVPIIRDFPEVFPEDLPGIPPARPVKFQIDLVPGAVPVARAPYRLALSEMKELAKQLQELSDKGFIRPNSSPWGALVLFVKKKDRSF
nr:hypothetical protein [Tanacetum cinerariifolium]